MANLAQFILVIIISVLAALVLLVSWQVIRAVEEFKQLLRKLNMLIESGEKKEKDLASQVAAELKKNYFKRGGSSVK